MAQPRFFHDDVPAHGSQEAARTAELALSLAALADAWVDRVKCGPTPLSSAFHASCCKQVYLEHTCLLPPGTPPGIGLYYRPLRL